MNNEYTPPQIPEGDAAALLPEIVPEQTTEINTPPSVLSEAEKRAQDKQRKEEKEECEDEKRKKKERNNIIHVIRYGAAALSFVSFLTTAQGMEQIIGKEKSWQAYLISFGVQAIVLVMGLWFFRVREIIRKADMSDITTDGAEDTGGIFKQLFRHWGEVFSQKHPWYKKGNTDARRKQVVVLLITCLYLAAISFSSFFSFVFLTDRAYSKVKETDYNATIDMFLAQETRHLKSFNDEVGKLLIDEIRQYGGKFEDLVDTVQADVSTSVNDILQSKPIIS